MFDGVLPHVAGAGRKWLNHRFASPIVSGGQQYEDHFNIADSFPFSYAWSTDHLTGKQDAILKRPDTDPLVFHTPDFHGILGAPRLPGAHRHARQRPEATGYGAGLLLVQLAAFRRSAAEDAVARHRTELSPMSYPRRCSSAPISMRWTAGRPMARHRPPAASRCARTTRWCASRRGGDQFPVIPGVATPASPNVLPLLDFGPDVERGILREPPRLCRRQHAGWRRASSIPCWCRRWIATATTYLVCARRWWGRRSAPIPGGTRAHVAMAMASQLRFEGSYIPFPNRPQERRVTGDPRLQFWNAIPTRRRMSQRSLPRHANWWRKGLMLEEDVSRCAEAAADWGRPRHDVSLD